MPACADDISGAASVSALCVWSDCGAVASIGCGFAPKFVEARIACNWALVMLPIAPLRLYW